MWPAASPPTRTAIRRAFGVDVGELRPASGGFESDGFTDGTWFVKVFRFAPESDAALALTAELAARGLPVPAARRAVDGTYTGAHGDTRFALAPFVAGRTGTWDDVDVIAGAMRALHDITDLDLPDPPIEERCVEELRELRDHPWLAAHRDEAMSFVDRLEVAIERANATETPHVVCHHDLLPHNTLVDDAGRLVAVLDWGWTWSAPREHDLFAAFDAPEPARFLETYGATDVDLVHLEYALLARGVRDLTARVANETDRPGIETWGIDRLRRVDADLAQARRFS